MGANIDEAGLLAQIADLTQRLATAEAALLECAPDTATPPSLFTDTDTDIHSNSPGMPTPRDDSKTTKARRRVHTLAGMLRSRKAALEHLRAHPNTDRVEWAERLQRDQDRVQHWTGRIADARVEAQTKLDRRQQAEANGKGTPGTKFNTVDEYIRVRQAQEALATATARTAATEANPPTGTRVNTTDPTSRIMPGKHEGFDQRHNVQAVVCKNQFIISIGTHDSPNDKQALVNAILQARTNLDAAGINDTIEKALFDSGYASAANFTAELPVDLLLIAVEKEARQTQRLRDGASTAAEAWADMATRFEDPDNKKLYKRRAAMIEPLFAQLFARFSRNLSARGENVNTELHIWAVTHNLLKISRSRKSHPPT
jgi:hypothetical protein